MEPPTNDRYLQLGFERGTYGFDIEDLERMGERDVRAALHAGRYGHIGLPTFAFVSAWLADRDFLRIEEAVSIARRACEAAEVAAEEARVAAAAARSQRNTAIVAAMAAIIAAIAAVSDKIPLVLSMFR